MTDQHELDRFFNHNIDLRPVDFVSPNPEVASQRDIPIVTPGSRRRRATTTTTTPEEERNGKRRRTLTPLTPPPNDDIEQQIETEHELIGDVPAPAPPHPVPRNVIPSVTSSQPHSRPTSSVLQEEQQREGGEEEQDGVRDHYLSWFTHLVHNIENPRYLSQAAQITFPTNAAAKQNYDRQSREFILQRRQRRHILDNVSAWYMMLLASDPIEPRASLDERIRHRRKTNYEMTRIIGHYKNLFQFYDTTELSMPHRQQQQGEEEGGFMGQLLDPDLNTHSPQARAYNRYLELTEHLAILTIQVDMYNMTKCPITYDKCFFRCQRLVQRAIQRREQDEVEEEGEEDEEDEKDEKDGDGEDLYESAYFEEQDRQQQQQDQGGLSNNARKAEVVENVGLVLKRFQRVLRIVSEVLTNLAMLQACNDERMVMQLALPSQQQDFGEVDIESQTAFQNFLMFILRHLQYRSVRRYHEHCYVQSPLTVQVNGALYSVVTQAWKFRSEIQYAILESIYPKEYNMRQWSWFTSSPNMLIGVENFLKHTKDNQFQELSREQCGWSFSNGVFWAAKQQFYYYAPYRDHIIQLETKRMRAKYTLEQKSDAQIRSHLIKRFPPMPHKLITSKLFAKQRFRWTVYDCPDRDNPEHRCDRLCTIEHFIIRSREDQFIPANGGAPIRDRLVDADYNPMDLLKKQAPRFMHICEEQGWPAQVIIWMLAFIGRMFYPLGTHDQAQITMYFWGVPGSGKSTIINLVASLWEGVDKAYLQNTLETNFPLMNALLAKIILYPDVNQYWNLPALLYTEMVSMGSILIAQKFKSPITVPKWDKPMLGAGNGNSFSSIICYVILGMIFRDQVNVARRLAIMYYDKHPKKINPNLNVELEREMDIIFSVAHCYYWRLFVLDPRKNEGIWERLDPYFWTVRTKVQNIVSPTISFVRWALVSTQDATQYVTVTDFMKIFSRWIDRHATFGTKRNHKTGQRQQRNTRRADQLNLNENYDVPANIDDPQWRSALQHWTIENDNVIKGCEFSPEAKQDLLIIQEDDQKRQYQQQQQHNLNQQQQQPSNSPLSSSSTLRPTGAFRSVTSTSSSSSSSSSGIQQR